MRKLCLAAVAALTAASAASPVAAAAVTTNLGVKIIIQAACTVATPSDLDFGTQGVLAANVDQSSSLSVTCTSATPYTISLSAGAGSGATTAVRKMTGPAAATINYSIYRDAGRTQIWGTGSDVLSGNGTGSAQTIPVYGRVPPQTTPAVGSYADTVGVTVTF